MPREYLPQGPVGVDRCFSGEEIPAGGCALTDVRRGRRRPHHLLHLEHIKGNSSCPLALSFSKLTTGAWKTTCC